MKKMCSSLVMICFFLSQITAFSQTNESNFISSSGKHLDYMGRVSFANEYAEFYWSGTTVSINVKATTVVKALLDTKTNFNYYYVIVDGNISSLKKIKVEAGKKMYTLVTFTDKEKHHIELVKLTDSDKNTTFFYGFEIDKKGKVLAPNKKKSRKLEFFGDSITCGYGADVQVDSTDSALPKYFNNFKSYDAITARHFDAQYHCTAKSGIGVTVSYFPEIMPEIFDRISPFDKNSKWNFSNYTPDIVVVNLFQNDKSLLDKKDHQQFIARFGDEKPTDEFMINAYSNFISQIRSKYPEAQIICCLGNMDVTREGSKWPGLIDTAVLNLNDKKIATLFFPYKKTTGHPKAFEQQAMANELIQFIEKNNYFE